MFTAWNKYLFTCLNSGSCARENMNFYRNQVEAVYFYNAVYLALYSFFFLRSKIIEKMDMD